MATPDDTVDSNDLPLVLPCDHSFAYSVLTESIEESAFSIEEIGSTADGAMYIEISFTCPRCHDPVRVELLESLVTSPG